MTETWQADGDGWVGHWIIDLRGQPVTIRGDFDLTPTAGGCCYSVTDSVRAKVLLVRKQVEKYICSQTVDAATQGLQCTADYLGQN